MAPIAFTLTILIICVSILFGIHMYFCWTSEIKMYADPKYDERIRKLEEEIKELRREV